MIICMPILTDTYLGELAVNIAVSDIIMPFVLISSMHQKKELDPAYQSQINKYVKGCFAFVFILFLSTTIGVVRWQNAQSGEISLSFFKIVKIIIAMCYGYIFFVAYFNEDNRKNIYRYSLIAGLILAVTCILGVLFLRFRSLGWAESYRAKGTTDDPNLTATLLFIYIGMTLYYLIYENKSRFIYWISIVLMIVALLMTASKGMIVSLLVALIVFMLFQIKNPRTTRNVILLLIVLFLIGRYAYTQYEQVNKIINRLMVVLEYGDDSNTSRLLTGRNNIWESGLNSLRHGLNPIFGVGYGFYGVASRFYGAVSERATAHNTPLSMFVELGLFGLIPILVLYYRMICYSVKMAKNRVHVETVFIVLAVIVQSIALNVQNIRNVWTVVCIVSAQWFLWQSGNDDYQNIDINEYENLEDVKC